MGVICQEIMDATALTVAEIGSSNDDVPCNDPGLCDVDGTDIWIITGDPAAEFQVEIIGTEQREDIQRVKDFSVAN